MHLDTDSFFFLDRTVLYLVFKFIFTIFTELRFHKTPTNVGNSVTVKGVFLHSHIYKPDVQNISLTLK